MHMVNALLLHASDFLDPQGPMVPANFKPDVFPLEQDAHVILVGNRIISHRSASITSAPVAGANDGTAGETNPAAMSWAFRQRCANAGQKLVLLMLAHQANSQTGRCDPAQRRLAEACSMGLSTLKRHLSELQDAGFITVEAQKADGVNLPNQYVLNLSAADVPAEGAQASGRGSP